MYKAGAVFRRDEIPFDDAERTRVLVGKIGKEGFVVLAVEIRSFELPYNLKRLD
jgi:hypothetical protein